MNSRDSHGKLVNQSFRDLGIFLQSIRTTLWPLINIALWQPTFCESHGHPLQWSNYGRQPFIWEDLDGSRVFCANATCGQLQWVSIPKRWSGLLTRTSIATTEADHCSVLNGMWDFPFSDTAMPNATSQNLSGMKRPVLLARQKLRFFGPRSWWR